MTADILIDLDRLPHDPARPPAVLLGGVNLVRTLGLAGIPAIVASANADEPAFASRHCAARCLLPPLEAGAAAADALVALGDRLRGIYGGRVPLLYGSDDALQLLHAHRERLQRYFLFLASAPEVGESLVAKDRFQAFAESRGLPVPRALDWDTLGDAAGPVVAKPRIKTDWHESLLCQRLFGGDGKARVFANGAAARAEPLVALYREQLAFQEYVPGGTDALWSFHGFADENGEVLEGFTGRKIRTFPAVDGESAFIELARDASLEAAGREAAKRCPLQGVFKMDFKRDPRDGRWVLLEINARCNLWNYLGAVNGVNLLRVAYDYLLHREKPARAAWRTDRRWLAFELDAKAYRQMARRGELSAAKWIASIAFSRNVHNLFAWSDPMPWVRFWSHRAARLLNRRSGRVMAALRQWRSTAS